MTAMLRKRKRQEKEDAQVHLETRVNGRAWNSAIDSKIKRTERLHD